MSDKDDDKLLTEAKARFKRCEDFEADFRTLFVADLKFVNADSDNGYQWPENMRKARENGRAALAQLFGGTLRAAGLPVAVTVRFAGEPRGADETRWNLTRSLEEVLGNAE